MTGARGDATRRGPEGSESRAVRLAVLQQTSGSLTGTYQPDYLEQLREDWPE